MISTLHVLLYWMYIIIVKIVIINWVKKKIIIIIMDYTHNYYKN